jgi:ABC-type nickel/cobalt efflux system permease component RcnA
VLAAAREAFVAGMQLSSAIAAGIGVALAVLALVALRNQQNADRDGGAGEGEEELVTASATHGGPPDDASRTSGSRSM